MDNVLKNNLLLRIKTRKRIGKALVIYAISVPFFAPFLLNFLFGHNGAVVIERFFPCLGYVYSMLEMYSNSPLVLYSYLSCLPLIFIFVPVFVLLNFNILKLCEISEYCQFRCAWNKKSKTCLICFFVCLYLIVCDLFGFSSFGVGVASGVGLLVPNASISVFLWPMDNVNYIPFCMWLYSLIVAAVYVFFWFFVFNWKLLFVEKKKMG